MPRKRVPADRGRKGASLHVREQARALYARRVKEERPWSVVYRTFGSKKAITKRFVTEKAARRFYKSLWQRRLSPESQSIVPPSAE